MATFFFLYSSSTINQLGAWITSIPNRTFFLRKEDRKRVRFRPIAKAITVLLFLFDLQLSVHLFLKWKRITEWSRGCILRKEVEKKSGFDSLSIHTLSGGRSDEYSHDFFFSDLGLNGISLCGSSLKMGKHQVARSENWWWKWYILKVRNEF